MDNIIKDIATAACDGEYSYMVEIIRYFIWDSGEAENAGEEERALIMSCRNAAINSGDEYYGSNVC